MADGCREKIACSPRCRTQAAHQQQCQAVRTNDAKCACEAKHRVCKTNKNDSICYDITHSHAKGRRAAIPRRADGHMTILVLAQVVQRPYLSLRRRKNKRPVALVLYTIVLLLLPSPTSRTHHCYNPPVDLQPKRFLCTTHFYHRRCIVSSPYFFDSLERPPAF